MVTAAGVKWYCGVRGPLWAAIFLPWLSQRKAFFMNNIVKPGGILQIFNGHGHHCGCEGSFDDNPGNGNGTTPPDENPGGGTTPPAVGPGAMLDISYEEQFTGAYDRRDPANPKKIYVKTIDCGVMPNTTEKRIPTGVDNIEQCVFMFGYFGAEMMDGSPSGYFPLPYLLHTGHPNFARLAFWTGDNSIIIGSEMDWSRYSGTYVTIYYTKNE